MAAIDSTSAVGALGAHPIDRSRASSRDREVEESLARPQAFGGRAARPPPGTPPGTTRRCSSISRGTQGTEKATLLPAAGREVAPAFSLPGETVWEESGR